MALINVIQSDSFENWRVKSNQLSQVVGDVALLDGALASTTIVGAINEIIDSTFFENQAGGPVTVTTATYTVGDNTTWLIIDYAGSHTITLPSAALNEGRNLTIKTLTANTVISASANVAPLTSATPGTAILSATAGKWAKLISDGTNWINMEGN